MKKNLTNKELVRLIKTNQIQLDDNTVNALIILCGHLKMTPGDLVHDLTFSSLSAEGLLSARS